jgi:hypothetical protein
MCPVSDADGPCWVEHSRAAHGPVGVGFFLLYRLLGVSSFAGVLVLCGAAAVQVGQIWLLNHYVDAKQEWSDARLQLITETLGIVRQLKLGGLASHFQRRIEGLREEQMRWSMRAHVVDACAWSLWDLLPSASVCAVFATASLVAPSLLVSEKIFATCAIIEIIRFPLTYLPEVRGGPSARSRLSTVAPSAVAASLTHSGPLTCRWLAD